LTEIFIHGLSLVIFTYFFLFVCLFVLTTTNNLFFFISIETHFVFLMTRLDLTKSL